MSSGACKSRYTCSSGRIVYAPWTPSCCRYNAWSYMEILYEWIFYSDIKSRLADSLNVISLSQMRLYNVYTAVQKSIKVIIHKDIYVQTKYGHLTIPILSAIYFVFLHLFLPFLICDFDYTQTFITKIYECNLTVDSNHALLFKLTNGLRVIWMIWHNNLKKRSL